MRTKKIFFFLQIQDKSFNVSSKCILIQECLDIYTIKQALSRSTCMMSSSLLLTGLRLRERASVGAADEWRGALWFWSADRSRWMSPPPLGSALGSISAYIMEIFRMSETEVLLCRERLELDSGWSLTDASPLLDTGGTPDEHRT